MPEVTLRAGRPYLVMHRERREDLEELAARLRSAGINVDIEITEYVPGRRGVAFNLAEAVAFYIAGAVTTALLSNVMSDIYEAAKKWATARFSRKVALRPNGLHRPETFTIYGPDGETPRTWTIDEEGEHES